MLGMATVVSAAAFITAQAYNCSSVGFDFGNTLLAFELRIIVVASSFNVSKIVAFAFNSVDDLALP